VSGLWSSILALGLFVGPSVGGILMDNFGFRWGSMFVLGGGIILMIMVILVIVYDKRKQSALENETDPLLGSQTNISQTDVETPVNSENSQSRQMYGSTTESNT
jgi:MFS family permease